MFFVFLLFLTLSSLCSTSKPSASSYAVINLGEKDHQKINWPEPEQKKDEISYEIKNHYEETKESSSDESKSDEDKDVKKFFYNIKDKLSESKHSYGYEIKNHNEKEEKKDKGMENTKKVYYNPKGADKKEVRYEFEYGVEDYKTKDIKYQKESRKGDKVEGKYVLYQPDGKLRIVKYNANKDDGFSADVKYKKLD